MGYFQSPVQSQENQSKADPGSLQYGIDIANELNKSQPGKGALVNPIDDIPKSESK